jgi:demethylmenaquinone methyltransferase/2-methoxy-6-polyprenyl-1,4-benzoquinol methylase
VRRGKLPFPDGHFDLRQHRFRLRNVTRKERGARRMMRTRAAPVGVGGVSEFSQVLAAAQAGVRLYSFSDAAVGSGNCRRRRRQLPLSRESIRDAPTRCGSRTLMVESGFDDVAFHNLAAGRSRATLGLPALNRIFRVACPG